MMTRVAFVEGDRERKGKKGREGEREGERRRERRREKVEKE